MKYELFKEVALLKDIHNKKLKKGDVATVIEYHPSESNADGYTIEVFNALGETFAVATVSEDDIAPLSEGEVLSVRNLETEMH